VSAEVSSASVVSAASLAALSVPVVPVLAEEPQPVSIAAVMAPARTRLNNFFFIIFSSFWF
jgi:hypothetical protein